MAVSTAELVPMLKNHNVAFTQATGECVDSATAAARRQMKLLYAGFGLLLVLGAGGGVYLLRLKKQVKAGSNPPINSQLIRKIVGAQQAQAQAAGGVSGCLTLTSLDGGRNIVLQPNRPQIIGCSAPADIMIDKAQISARHVRLLFDGRRLEAEDLGSTNGTFANGSKITRSVLNAGDVLQLTADPVPAGGMAGSFSDGLSGNANTDCTVFSPPPISIEKNQMLPNPNAAEQSAKTQILADAAPAIAQDDALKTHIFGANRAAQPEARAKGMRELPAVGWLVITSGAGRGTNFRLVQGSNRIGRNAELEISLDFGDASDPAVSRETNATIVYDPQAGEFFVERDESRNLPLLNGRTIRGEPVLAARDIIRVGNTELVFVPLCGEAFRWGEYGE